MFDDIYVVWNWFKVSVLANPGIFLELGVDNNNILFMMGDKNF